MPTPCVIAYLRVSTVEQSDSGAGLDAQRAAIARYADAHGLIVTAWHTDIASGGDHPALRDGLATALHDLARCPTGVLIAAKLDRLARSTRDVLWLRDRSAAQGWSLVAADGSVDTTTPHGRMLTTVMAAAAELERDLIRSRTREALATRKAKGVRLGRPVLLADDVRARIVRERGAGGTYPAIAEGLNADGVTTATGKAWRATGVAKVIKSVALDREAQAARQGAAA